MPNIAAPALDASQRRDLEKFGERLARFGVNFAVVSRRGFPRRASQRRAIRERRRPPPGGGARHPRPSCPAAVRGRRDSGLAVGGCEPADRRAPAPTARGVGLPRSGGRRSARSGRPLDWAAPMSSISRRCSGCRPGTSRRRFERKSRSRRSGSSWPASTKSWCCSTGSARTCGSPSRTRTSFSSPATA